MNEYQTRYPRLKEILGFLHQDWDVMFEWHETKPDYRTALRKLKAAGSEQDRQNAITELKQIIALNLGEIELREIINRRFRSAFYPPGAGLTYQQWLEEVLSIFEEPMETTKKHFLPKFVGEV